MTTSTTKFAYGTRVSINIDGVWCAGCGIPYGLPAGFLDDRRRDHKGWNCPNGCNMYFPKGLSEAQVLQKKLDRAEADANRERVRANGERVQRERAERQRAAAKGQVTRIKNRVSKGVCPCCNRTFENVARHMDSKHPDYVGAPIA